MSDRPVPPPEALFQAACAWCGNSIYGCPDNWHLLDGSEVCLTAGGCFHVSDEEIDACQHLDDCEIIDGAVYCGDCGEPIGDLE